jgi:hypothetical protein
MDHKLWIGRFGTGTWARPGTWALYDPDQQVDSPEHVWLYLVEDSGSEPPRWAVFSKEAARKALSIAPPSAKRTALLAEYVGGEKQRVTEEDAAARRSRVVKEGVEARRQQAAEEIAEARKICGVDRWEDPEDDYYSRPAPA